jgi:hypothetical protein
MILAVLWIVNEREDKPRPFDWLGFTLAGTACTSLMYSLELLGRQNSEWSNVSIFLGYSLIAGWLGIRHMRRTEHPMIEFACLKAKTFAVSTWGGSTFRVAINASPFLLPLMFQISFGLSPFQSGLLVLAMFAGNLTMKSVTTPILKRFGFRRVLLTNGIITAFLLLACGLLSPQTPRAVILAVLFLHGLSRSMQFTSLAAVAFVDIPKPLMSSATSFSAVVTQMAMGMGVAAGAVALRAAASLRGETAGTPSLMDFHVAFWIMAVLALLAVSDVFTLDPNAGAEVSGYRAA